MKLNTVKLNTLKLTGHTLCYIKCDAERALTVEIPCVRIPGWSVRNIRAFGNAMDDPNSALRVKHKNAFNVTMR